MHRPYWSEVLDHLGLVARMFDELGIGDVLDRTLPYNPETRLVTVVSAVNAMALKRLGFVNQQLYLVPMVFQNKPKQRLIALGVEAQHLHDDTLGRTLDMLSDYGVTALYSLIAAAAAQRLGLRRRLPISIAPASMLADACAEDAQHALTTFAQALQATAPHAGTVQPTPRDSRRGFRAKTPRRPR